MKLVIVCTACGDKWKVDARHARANTMLEAWRREHARQHEKDGDHGEISFSPLSVEHDDHMGAE